jgi:hypothetical protein
MTSVVLSFDIGIRNLAYCCLKTTGIETQPIEIIGWENVNLIEEGEKKVKQTCGLCKVQPRFVSGSMLVCARHVPSRLPLIKDLSGNVYKKLPKLSLLQEHLLVKNNIKVPLKGDRIMEELVKHYSIPIVQEKKVNSKDVGLDKIHDALRSLVIKNSSEWKSCTLICLENQPAFKNPHMKSVQMMLYSTIRDILQPNPPPIQLVHAGKKVKGMTKGDEGYKDRKAGSEGRADSFLAKPEFANTTWKGLYYGSKKKNDLADSLCMSIDHI